MSLFELMLYLFALAGVLLLSPAAMLLSHAIGAIDRPDGERKRHTVATPRLGGLVLYTVFAVGAAGLSLSDGRMTALLSGGGVLLAAGIADDVCDLPAALKLVFQVAASLVAVLSVGVPEGLYLPWIGAVALPAPLMTAGALVGLVLLINAVNLIDGADAVAGGVMTVGMLALSVACAGSGDALGASLCRLLTVCVLGFLAYNRPPATLFMGDGGSQCLGYAAGVLLLGGGASGELSIVSAALFFAVPLTDLVLSVVRRLCHGVSPLRADRGHLHHRLLARGLSVGGTCVALSGAAAASAALGLWLLP